MSRLYTRTPVCEPAILILIDASEKRTIYAVNLLDRSYVGVRLSSPALLEPKSAVKVRFKDGHTEEGTVIYCRCVEVGEYHAGVQLKSGVERRKEPRFSISGAVRLTLLHPHEDPHAVEARAHDISRTGVSVVCSTAVPPGTQVELRLPKSVIYGTVRNCVPTPQGYRVGVAIGDVINEEDGTRESELSAWDVRLKSE